MPRVAQRAGGTALALLPSLELGCAPSLHGHGLHGKRETQLDAFPLESGTKTSTKRVQPWHRHQKHCCSECRAPEREREGRGQHKARDGQNQGEMWHLTPSRASSDPGTRPAPQPCCGGDRGTARGLSLIWFSSVLITALLPAVLLRHSICTASSEHPSAPETLWVQQAAQHRRHPACHPTSTLRARRDPRCHHPAPALPPLACAQSGAGGSLCPSSLPVRVREKLPVPPAALSEKQCRLQARV